MPLGDDPPIAWSSPNPASAASPGSATSPASDLSASGPSASGSSGRASGKRPSAGAHFRPGQIVRMLGLSRRQLQYWAETGLVVPSARTGGGHRRYTFQDLVALKAAKQLIDAGVSLQRIRSSLGSLARILPQVRRPLSELVLVATGDVVLVLQEGAAFEAVSGQEWILEVARFEREVAHWLGTAALRRGQAVGPAPRSRGAVRDA